MTKVKLAAHKALYRIFGFDMYVGEYLSLATIWMFGHVISLKRKDQLLFSERNGYTKMYKFGQYRLVVKKRLKQTDL